MEFECVKQERGVALKVKGRMDAVTAPEFERECNKWIEQGEKFLVVDFANLEYISSAGLRGVLAVGKTLKGRGGKIALCGVRGMVKEVFDISGFTVIFPVFEDADAAMAGA